MLTLLIGDLFIPDRSVAIPTQFRKLLSPNAPSVPSNAKISQVLCLGNITQSASTLRFLYELSPFFCGVRGEFDDENIISQQLQLLDPKSEASLPLFRVVSAGDFRIGFTSGHQIVPRNDPLSLSAFAREIDVDILVWGGTHRVEAYTSEGKFFINPGSATGAFSMNWPDLDDEGDDDDEANDDEANANENEDIDVTIEEQEEQEGSENDIEIQRSSDEHKKESSGSQDKEEAKKESHDNKQTVKNLDSEEFDASYLSSSLPSFCLLDTNASRCTLYIYTLLNDEVKVDKVMYSKE